MMRMLTVQQDQRTVKNRYISLSKETIVNLGTPNLRPLLTGGRCSEVPLYYN